MAEVRPFRALRYAPGIDLAQAICPPFDIISPEQQRALHEQADYNAVHLELAENGGGGRYQRARETLDHWRREGTLFREELPAFYVYDQRFERDGVTYSRRTIFAQVRLEPWDRGIVLPHEQTFGAPKEDRLRLLRAIRTNTSPVFLLYRDHDNAIKAQLESAGSLTPIADFSSDDGQSHTLRRIDSPSTIDSLTTNFERENLYIADGHHRYETALGYRDECRANAADWTGREPENFALVALVSAADPGLVVLPIHRVTAAGAPLSVALDRLTGLFDVKRVDSLESVGLNSAGPSFGLASRDSGALYRLSVADPKAIDALLPQERSILWRSLDYAIANHVILGYALSLDEAQMSNYDTLWFTEDADEAVREAHKGRGRYAVLMNPVPATRVLDVADSGERMPQKSTFFYPKMPTGLVFNPLDE